MKIWIYEKRKSASITINVFFLMVGAPIISPLTYLGHTAFILLATSLSLWQTHLNVCYTGGPRVDPEKDVASHHDQLHQQWPWTLPQPVCGGLPVSRGDNCYAGKLTVASLWCIKYYYNVLPFVENSVARDVSMLHVVKM